VLVVFAFTAWRAIGYRFRTASIDEVWAVVPPDLLKREPVDEAAQQRYVELVELIRQLGESSSSERTSAGATTLHSKNEEFWRAKSMIRARMVSLLKEGPIQCPSGGLEGDITWLPPNSLYWFLSMALSSAKLFAANRNFDDCTLMLILTERLGERLMDDQGDLEQYAVASAVRLKTAQAINEAICIPGFPLSDCKLLLNGMTPAPPSDVALTNSLRKDFQTGQLLWLPDPTKSWKSKNDVAPASLIPMAYSEPGLGTYDAIQTAKEVASMVSVAIANAKKPLSEFDRSAERTMERETSNLPRQEYVQQNETLRKFFARWSYHLSMDITPNSIGRKLLGTLSCISRDVVVESCEWRATQNATRVLLASRIYRAGHGGKLPATADGFLPLVGSWPQDPFNGKPMIFDSKQERVYSVGSNLIDDGGIVSFTSAGAPDVGVSLKL